MILIDSNKNNYRSSNEVDELKIHRTEDDSLSLYSLNHKEAFHSISGALKESIDKYLKPSQIDQFTQPSKINVLDVCLGLGYNSGCILEALLKKKIEVEWHGLEIDQRPLSLALEDKKFRITWSADVLSFFNSIKETGMYINNLTRGKVHWGDARKGIYEINGSLKFDLILLDPFSPQKCPELWTEEFLSLLSNKLSLQGRLITYSSAASVRSSLKRSGLKIYSVIPSDPNKNLWSSGTVATKKPLEEKFILKNSRLRKLSLRELEHLKTRSSIPYRDPTGTQNSKEIIITREKEQSESPLKITSSWRKRWDTAKERQSH